LLEDNSESWIRTRRIGSSSVDHPITIFEASSAVVLQLCAMPDDSLDVAEAYLRDHVPDLGEQLRIAAHGVVLEVDGNALGKRLEEIRILKDAMNTEQFDEAYRVVTEHSAALDAQAAIAERVAREADSRVQRATARLRWSLSWPKALRIGVLATVAVAAWQLGDRLAGDSWVAQLLVVAGSFVLIDRLVVGMLVEPWLAARRRGAVKRCAQLLADEYDEAARQVAIVSRMLLERED